MIDTQPADTIFLGGTILTVDAAFSEAEALAVRAGRIVAVGGRDDVLRLRGPATEIVDLRGGALLPGFVEAHGHPFMTATTLAGAVDVRPFGTPTAEEVLRKLDEAVAGAAPGESVVLYGIDPLLHRGLRLPTMVDLDARAPRNPVVLITNNGHAAYANRLAFDQAGVHEETPDPPGARYLRDAQGALTGVAEEGAAIQRLAAPAMPRFSGEQSTTLLRALYDELASVGLTATSDHGMRPAALAAYRALAEAKGTPIRVRAYLVGEPDGRAAVGPGEGDAMFRVAGIKLWADGSPFVGNIALSRPYLNTPTTLETMHLPPDNRGTLNYPDAEMRRMVAAYARQGYQVAVHAHGDVAIDQVLDACEAARADQPADHRLRLEHCGVIRDDQLARCARLGVTVSFFMTHVYYWGDVLRDAMFPGEIAERWSATGSAERAGVRFSLHNDGIVSPANPLLNIQTAITRRTRDSRRVLGPEQRISVEAAIRAHTIDAAYQLFLDDEAGSLEPGKVADLVHLAADPRRVDTEAIAAISVEATYLAGRQVWPLR